MNHSFNCNQSARSCSMMKVSLIALPGVALCSFLIAVTIAAGNEVDSTHMRRVIVDVDAGPDDAWALYYLLKTPGVHVEAISCVKGNTNVTNVGRNVLRILTLLKKETEIPVFLGSNERLITPEPVVDPADMFFGEDGFSDIPGLLEPDMTLLRDSAIYELRKLIKQHPNEITFINLGPLTNLALLLKVHPETRGLIKDLYIMGGNRHGVGNTKNAAEFNFYGDPEGANIVINNFHGNITILPWETASRDNLVTNQTWRFDVLGNTNNPIVQMLNKVEKKPLGEHDNWMPCDVLVPMAFTNPAIITDSKQYRGDVELHGWLTRGQLVLDHINEGLGNITIIDNMNETAILQSLKDLVSENGSYNEGT